MNSDEVSTLTLESAAAALLLAVAYKVWRMKCASHSKCCGDQVEFQSSNPGAAA